MGSLMYSSSHVAPKTQIMGVIVGMYLFRPLGSLPSETMQEEQSWGILCLL